MSLVSVKRKPVWPDEDALVDDLTEDEDRLFPAAVLNA